MSCGGHSKILPHDETNLSHLRPVGAVQKHPAPLPVLEMLRVQMGGAFLESEDPAYMADLDGGLLYQNGAFEKLSRPDEGGESNGPPFSFQEIAAAVRQDQEVFHYRFSLCRNGHSETFHSRHFPIRDAEGRLTAIAGVVQSSGTSAGPRQQLREERQRFEDLARLVSDWLWETDAHFNFTYVSSRVFDRIGILPREIEGKSLFTFGCFKAVGESTALPGPGMRSPFREELYEVNLPDGGVQTFRLSGLPVFNEEDGKFRGYRGTAEDVTNETLAWSRAIESRIHLVEAIEGMGDALSIFDTSEKLILCNSRFRKDFLEGTPLVEAKATLADILRANVEAGHIVVSGQNPAGLMEQLNQLYQEPGALELELRDGVWVNFALQSIADGGWIGFFSDITALKEREAVLQAAKETAEAASQTKSDFLANMSHELRTPLNAVIGFSEVMHRELMGPLGSDAYRDYAKDILESARHLLGIINTILDVSKAEAGGLVVEDQLLDLSQVTESALRVVRQRAKDNSIRLTCKIVPGLPRFRGDGTKLKQILLNLLTNAITFTSEGGQVDVALGTCPKGGLLLVIADNGIGIAPDDIPKAMAPFGQVDSSISRRYPGTGLGLPLTKKLTELHGGTLVLSSVPGQGTKVTVWFPPERFESSERFGSKEPPANAI